MKILIIGGAGKLGSLVANNLFAMGFQVRIITRKPAKAKKINKDIEVVEGDVRNVASLTKAIKGVSTIIGIYEGTGNGESSPENVDYKGTLNIVNLIQHSNIQFIYITNIYVTKPENPLNAEGRILDWRHKAEQFVRASSIPYTIIRPAWLKDNNNISIRAEQGDKGDGSISRASVALVIAKSVQNTNAYRKTFEIYSGGKNEEPEWSSFFDNLKND